MTYCTCILVSEMSTCTTNSSCVRQHRFPCGMLRLFAVTTSNIISLMGGVCIQNLPLGLYLCYRLFDVEQEISIANRSKVYQLLCYCCTH